MNGLGKRTGPRHASHIGRQNHKVFQLLALDILRKLDHGRQVVGRNVEEALNLGSMEIDCDHAVCTRNCHEICNQFGTDGFSRANFPILARIPEKRNDRGYARCPCFFLLTHPSLSTWTARAMARASGGTSWVIVDPVAVYAPS